ncbi:MAG: secretion protein F [Lachnospiraceae bacterium]|nr:secretion protein F [Lachnospiraceae bacterium]
MKLILFCVFLFLASGLFLLLSGLMRLPTLKTSRMMMNRGKEEKTLSKTLDALYMETSVKLAGYIHINAHKKSRMENVLRASGLGMTPEVYTAYAYVKAGSIFLLIIPALYVFPLAALFVILLGIMVYYRQIQKADEMLREKREKIEGELYRFVSTITQELKNSRDVLSMLEHYKENAGADFRRELDIVCADMRSSSYEAALTRFEARLNSPQLSDVVRGLIGVLRGDDGAVYFQMLTHDFKQAELQRLKAKAAKIPPKIRVYSFAMLMCFLVTYFVIIIYEIIRSMETLF